MRSEEISHEGVVKEIRDGLVCVEIVSESACGACRAASLCTSAEAMKKMIEVPVTSSGEYRVGESVEVYLKGELGLKAAFLCYVVPLLIFLILVVSLSFTSLGELVVGAIALAGMAVWYGVVYLMRDRISRHYHFHIRPKV